MDSYKVKAIRTETPSIKTYTFDAPGISEKAKPGQFVMLWVPRVGEIPLSISNISPLEVTVRKVGEVTTALYAIKEGTYLGIRGPYGKGYSLKENSIIIAGGCGIASLMPLIKKIKKSTVIFGAKTAEELLFLDRLKNPIICTDDGTAGKKGLASDVLEDILENKRFAQGYTCGPEVMMVKVCELLDSKGIPVQASLERILKCGIGLCGSCCIDDSGIPICKSGPVFDYKDIKNSEFGKYKRTKSGKKVPI